MTNRLQYQRADHLKRIIHLQKRIHKYDLMEEAKISISTYEKIKPWLEYKFSDFIKYEKSTKEWVWIAEEYTEN